MKFLFFSFVAIFACLFSACDHRRDYNFDRLENFSPEDSLIFFYTQLRAYEYWDEAVNDTALRSQEARKQFIDGFEKTFSAVRKGSKPYNRGMELGVRVAINLIKFERIYGIHVDRQIVIEALKDGLKDGADIPELEYQHHYYRILADLKRHQREIDHELAAKRLDQIADSLGMSRIEDNLFAAVSKSGEGPYAQYGNRAFVSVDYERADGRDMAVPSPGSVVIGADGMPHVLSKAYSMLNKGAVAKFATTAEAVFGSRTFSLGLKPEDIILINITMNNISSDPASPDSY